MEKSPEYVIEMLHITKEFPGIKANDDITLQLKKGEIHALLGENGAGKSTLMSVLFGLYQPEAGEIRKNGVKVEINDPNDATALKIGMVHQHFKLVEVFTVLDNIILGAGDDEARLHPEEGSARQGSGAEREIRSASTSTQRSRISPSVCSSVLRSSRCSTAIMRYLSLTSLPPSSPPQEIDELMATMREFAKEGKSILFISHKLNEIMEVSDRVTVLRKGKYVGTVNTSETNKQELSNMMVGRPVQLEVVKDEAKPTDEVLRVEHFSVPPACTSATPWTTSASPCAKARSSASPVSTATASPSLYTALPGLISPPAARSRSAARTSPMPPSPTAARTCRTSLRTAINGLVLDFTLEQNMVLQRFQEPQFEKGRFHKQRRRARVRR